MKLTAVIYELFESDLDGLDNDPGLNSHEIEREIKFVFDDASTIYISWCREPVQYAVGYQNKSWFEPPPGITLDATNWPLWQPLSGQVISLGFLDADHQILEIKTIAGAVYCSSFSPSLGDHWLADVLNISAAVPPSYDKEVTTTE